VKFDKLVTAVTTLKEQSYDYSPIAVEPSSLGSGSQFYLMPPHHPVLVYGSGGYLEELD